MAHIGMIFLGIMMILFALGWIGCALTIPMAAFKFLSVLFEKDAEGEQQAHQEFESARTAS